MTADPAEATRLSASLPLLLSGRSEGALRAHAGRWARWLEAHPEVPWEAALRTAARRPHLDHRAAIQANGTEGAVEALRALSAGLAHPALTQDRARARSGLAFVFSGQGGQWRGMGRLLLEEVPAFAEAIEACEAAFAPHTGWSIKSALRGAPGESPSDDLDRFEISLCANFAMGVGLAAAFRALGITPDAVVGHSLGEMTAAVVAGVTALEDGARGVSTTARLVAGSDREGGMLFVSLPMEEAAARIEALADLHIGIVDGPGSTVLSGGLTSLRAIEEQLRAEGVFHRRVKINAAPHSAHMDALLPSVCASMASTVPRESEVTMVSSITGRLIDGAELTAAHWGQVLGAQVRFDRAVEALLEEGIDTFLELSPRPLLGIPIQATCHAAEAREVAVLGAMRRGRGGLSDLHRTLGALHGCGHRVPWRSLVGARGKRLPLPALRDPGEDPTAAPEVAVDEAAARASAELRPSDRATASSLREVEAIVRQEMAAVLELLDPAALEEGAQIQALGLDSLKVLDLKNRIGKRIGLRLPQHFLYEHPTLEQATLALAAELGIDPMPAPSPKPAKLRDALAEEPSLRARIERVLEPLLCQVRSALGLEGPGSAEIDPRASLKQLGIDDVLGAELCLRIQRETGLRVFPREIVEQDTLLGLATHIAEAYGPYRSTGASVSLEELDAQIASPYHDWPLEEAGEESGERSDQELVFILSPPRSGSTLLRVMLAGHSQLFSPQELYLAPFETMATYDAYLNGTVLNMGLVSAIAEVISRTGSWNLYRQWVREAKPTAEVYDFFRERIGARALVDKSPLFFPPLAVLRRLARRYPRARFIHLIRHPVSCIGSYGKERFQGIFKETEGLDPYDAAEWCWTRVHEGIRGLAEELPASRFAQVHFEDLAVDPERVMRRLCPALGIGFEPALLEPYSGHRMVAGGFQVGDPNFVRHKRIVADKSEAWREVRLPRPLSGPTLEVAERLGYDLGDLGELGPLRADGEAPSTQKEASAAVAMGGIGMEADIHLPEDILPRAPYRPSGEAPRSVLLTGATGFLGAFLLDELLRQTDATIHCLVRAKDTEHALLRLRENLEAYDLWREEHQARVVAIPGDLGRPDMGLAEEARAELAERIDAIYHCAAQVSWLLPYSHLREVNVGGLTRILRLACLKDTLPIHYVSSLGTAFMRPFEHREMVEWMKESADLGSESVLELPLGYIESKWVNARVVAQARERGIPISLYAPGLIGGHSVTGVDSLSESQFLHALIKGSAQLGAFPDALGWRFIPVDRTAERIIGCSLLPESLNLDLYLDSTSLIDPEEMVEVLRSYGYEVEQVPFAVWRQRVLDLADAHDTANALFGFTDVIYAFTPLRFRGQRMQMSWFLRNPDAAPPIRAVVGDTEHVDRDLLERLVGYYVRAGAMPPLRKPLALATRREAERVTRRAQ